MKLWGYYAFHTFINSIKKMFRSTFIIIMAVALGIGLIFGISAGIIATVIEDEMSSETEGDETTRDGYGDPEYGMFDENGKFLFYEDLYEEGLGGYDENGNFIYYEDALEQNLGYYDENGDFIFYYEEMTEEDVAKLLLVVEAAAGVLVLLLLGFGAHSGMKKGSDIFLMADVNFLFTAPMKPQSVLLFRLTFQMLAVITGSIYLLFQIPNLVMNAGVPLEACLIIYVAFLFAFVYQKLFSVGTYTLTATHPEMKKFVMPALIGITLLVAGGAGVAYLVCGDIWKMLEYSLSAEWTRLIPIVGWLKGVVIHAIHGNLWMTFLYSALNILGMAGLVYVIWHMKADFYEDAMAGAQAREDLLQAASENRKIVEVKADGTAKKDKRKVKEASDSLFGKAKGASTFLAKELIVRRRLAKFGLVTNTMIWYLTICVGMAIFNLKVLEISDFTVTGVILMVVLFFRNYGNPIAQETSMNWLFLVPESPYKKVFFAMMAGSYASAMDLLPGMLIAMLIMEVNPMSMLLWFVVLVTMDFMLSGVGLLLEALFPASAMQMVKASIQMMLKFVVIFFIVIAIVVGAMLGGFEMGLILTLIMNVFFGAVCFIIYPSMLHGGIS